MKNLRYYREKSGLTQRQLAALVDLPQARISDYERGARVPGLLAAVRMAHVLNVSLDQLVHEPVPTA